METVSQAPVARLRHDGELIPGERTQTNNQPVFSNQAEHDNEFLSGVFFDMEIKDQMFNVMNEFSTTNYHQLNCC